jgi:hypothetical protein
MIALNELLVQANIKQALIVDDAYDPVPLATDLLHEADEWTHFFDDVQGKDKQTIIDFFPTYTNLSADALRDSDSFIEALWKNREALRPDLINPLFQTYQDETEIDLARLSTLAAQLAALGLEAKTSGRNFVDKVASADIVFIDLFLSSAQRYEDMNLSINGLAEAIVKRKSSPPLVILMSRSTRLHSKRAEFQEKTRLFESSFRILSKDELLEPSVVNRAVRRLAQHYKDSLKLSAFVSAWEDGLTNAKNRTTALIRKLGLAEIAQIHHLLLSAEGEPAGSYLVDVFDKVLQYEIEAEPTIIDSAVLLNQLSVDDYPPPFVPGANDLLDLVQRSLFHSPARLKLPGSLESIVAFGDVLCRKSPSSENSLESDSLDILLKDVGLNDVLAILSPACDLQRNGVSRILLLFGTLLPLGVTDWNYKDDGLKTPVIDLGQDNRCWIKWNVKHIKTISPAELDYFLSKENSSFEIIARLREAHALELQQKLLSTMGRVGLVAPMPATFPMKIEAFLPNTDRKFIKLNIPLLDDGGVCYVGREIASTKAQERLVLTESACEAIFKELQAIDLNLINERTRELISRLQTSEELMQTLERGVPIPSAQNIDFIVIKAGNDPIGIIKRVKINLETEVLPTKFIEKAGIILSIFNPQTLPDAEETIVEALDHEQPSVPLTQPIALIDVVEIIEDRPTAA